MKRCVRLMQRILIALNKFEQLLLENMSSEEEDDEAGQASKGHKSKHHHAQYELPQPFCS